MTMPWLVVSSEPPIFTGSVCLVFALPPNVLPSFYKNTKVKITPLVEERFKSHKRSPTSLPTLAHFNDLIATYVSCNELGVTVGTVLFLKNSLSVKRSIREVKLNADVGLAHLFCR